MVRAPASYQCGPGSIPGLGVICGVEFVVGSRPSSERFFSGYSGFPLSSKTNTSKFQFDLESVPNSCCALNTLTLKKVIYFINFFILFFLQKSVIACSFFLLVLFLSALLCRPVP